MKATVMKPTDIEIKYVRIVVSVRYEEEDIPNDFPFRYGEQWDATVEMDTGKIVGWPDGRSHDMYMKVCDCGSYYLLDADKNVVGSIEDNYVPHGVVPGEYGDYIGLQIASDGTITNWPKKPDVDAFFDE
jgi:hypothetical protein